MIYPKLELLLSAPSEMEWVWILLVVVILFGGEKIPELAKGLGKGIRDFKDAKDGIQQEIENGIKEESTSAARTTVVEGTKTHQFANPIEIEEQAQVKDQTGL